MMPWLRVDDGFANHPKVAELSDAEFRVWVRLLCWCAQYSTPILSRSTAKTIVGVTPARLRKFTQIGLLENTESGWEVHDFRLYNPADPTAAERMKRYRDRNASRNGDRNESVTVTAPRAQAGARVPTPPHPSGVKKPLQELVENIADANEDTVVIFERFKLPEAAFRTAAEVLSDRRRQRPGLVSESRYVYGVLKAMVERGDYA